MENSMLWTILEAIFAVIGALVALVVLTLIVYELLVIRPQQRRIQRILHK